MAEPPAGKIRPLLTTAWTAATQEDKAAAAQAAAESSDEASADGGGSGGGGALPIHARGVGSGSANSGGEAPASVYVSRCAGMMLLALRHGGSAEVQVVLKGAARRIQAELKRLAASAPAAQGASGGAASGAGDLSAGGGKAAASRLSDKLAQRV